MTASDACMPQGQALLDAVGTAFARLRRRTIQVPVDPPVGRKDLKRNLVLNVVDEAAEAGTEMTIGGLADHLLVDPSVASRMVSDCISHGYLVRAASQQDGRRTVLQLPAPGAVNRLRESLAGHQRVAEAIAAGDL